MVERFGPAIVRDDGELDRQAVADLVFGDSEALRDLNAIVHPAVGAEIMARLAAEEATDHVVILDVPLLVENESFEVASVVVVDTDPEIAVRRLVAQRGFDETDARTRIARQASRQQRLARADWVVPNDGDREALEIEIERLWTWIQGLASSQHPGDPQTSAVSGNVRGWIVESGSSLARTQDEGPALPQLRGRGRRERRAWPTRRRKGFRSRH